MCRCSPTTRPVPPRWPGRTGSRWPSGRRPGPAADRTWAAGAGPAPDHGAPAATGPLLAARAGRARAGAGLRDRLDGLPGAERRRGRDHPGGHVHLRRQERRARPGAGHGAPGEREPGQGHPGQGPRPRQERGAGRGGQHLLHQPGLRHLGHRAGHLQPAHRGRRRWLDDHPAVREGGHRRARPHAVAQVQGGRARGQDLQGAGQEPDPGELPQLHLLRPRRVRHPGRRAGLLRQERRRPHRVRGGHAGRDHPGPVELGPGQEPGRLGAPLDVRAGPDGREEAGWTRPSGPSRPSRRTGSRTRRSWAGCPTTTATTSTTWPGPSWRPRASPRTRSTPRASPWRPR